MLIEPFSKEVDFWNGTITNADEKTIRRLSDLKGLVYDEQALERMLQEGNAIVYEVLKVKVPQLTGHLFFSTTKLFPGQIGREYFFTKGHYHINEKAAEIYIGLKGKGILLLKKETQVRTMEIRRGTVAYIPPRWGHRAINISTEPFIFMSVYPADAGFDYESVRRDGLGKRIMASKEGQYNIVNDLNGITR